MAAVEFKSQVGPSFGNNFNNRTEEALGTAVDFWKVFREGGFGDSPAPFAGWMIFVEDAPQSRSLARDKSPHFPVFPEFQGVSYADRYNNPVPEARTGEAIHSRFCSAFSAHFC